MDITKLVFIVGSGRCGTRTMKLLLSGVDHIEARHEYLRNAYQRESVLYYMGKISWREMADKLKDIYGAAAYYSQAPIFLDSSQHLAWCVDVLGDLFPAAKFVHLVRDGRKVASSFFYKLNIHDEKSWKNTLDWANGRSPIMPPPEEKFWWPWKPLETDRFRRICQHWVGSNLNIMLNCHHSKLMVRLEDLTASPRALSRMLDYIGVVYDPSFSEFLQYPKHVYTPINYHLTDEQNETFAEICGGMMERLGYDMDKEPEDVKYKM